MKAKKGHLIKDKKWENDSKCEIQQTAVINNFKIHIFLIWRLFAHLEMFMNAVGVVFLVKLRWPKSKSLQWFKMSLERQFWFLDIPSQNQLMNCNPKLHSKNTCPVLLGRIVFTICFYSWKGRMVGVDNKIVKREDLTRFNHNNYNFFNYDWLLKLLFSTNSLSKLLINQSHQFWVVQWNPFNTDTKWTCHNVRIIRVCVLRGFSEKMSGTHVLSI